MASVAAQIAYIMVQFGRTVAQAVSRRPLTAEARVRPCGICGGQSGTRTGFSPTYSVFTLLILFHRGSSFSYIIRG
jgi:hypothetical protein